MALPALKISEALLFNPQILADSDLAWRLQAEEYKQAYCNKSDVNFSFKSEVVYQFQQLDQAIQSFTLRETAGDRDCFFHAVNLRGFDREALVKKLLENAAGVETRNIFAHEIRQFLYLGDTGVHSDKKENIACQQLLTVEVKELFFVLKETEEALRFKVELARTELGEGQTQGKHSKELLQLLQEKSSRLTSDFETAYKAVLNANEAIYQYCCRQHVFEQYVKLYLEKACGYIPFSRDFGTETPKTTIDVINQLFKLSIQVYLSCNRGETRITLVNQPKIGTVIPIFHNGIDHFWGLTSMSPIKVKNSNDGSDRDKQGGEPDDFLASSIDAGQTVLLSLIEQIRKANEDFETSLKDFQDTAIQRQLKNLPARVGKSLERIEKLIAQKSELKRTLQKEMEQTQTFIESKIGFIEAESNNYSEKIQSIELLGKITDHYLALSKVLDPQPITEPQSDSHWRDERLRLEQQLVYKEPQVSQLLNQLLDELREMAEINFSMPNECFISYAWASKEASHEKWIQPFLTTLREHLRKAGVNATVDIRDNPPGGNIYQYMSRAETVSCVVVVGTESLFQKHTLGTTAVCNELILINRRRAKHQGKTLPILLSGDFVTSLPPYFSMYTTVRDWREKSYAANLKTILASIYGVGSDNVEYNNLWMKFEGQYPLLIRGLLEEDVILQLEKEGKLKIQQKELDSQQATGLFNSINKVQDGGRFVDKLKDNPIYKEQSQIVDELKLYVPPFSCDPNINPNNILETDDNLPSLEEEVIKNLRTGQEKVLLVKGEAGYGKTTFGYYLEQYFWNNFKKPDDPIVIFISLPKLMNPAHDLMNEHFTQRFGVIAAEQMIQWLKMREQVYFVLDAYDEIPQFQGNLNNLKNLFQSNNLALWKNAKFIITCRTTFLNRVASMSDGGSYKVHFSPPGTGMSRYALFKEFQMALFNESKIDQYVDKYMKLYGAKLSWDSARYKAEINKLPDVRKLIRNPLMLRMTVQALPIIVIWHEARQKASRDSFISITERDVFLAYLKDNLIRQEDKLRADNGGREIPNDIKTQFLRFLVDLSDQMQRNKCKKIKYIFRQDGSDEGALWAKPFFGWVSDKEKLKKLEMVRNNLTCFLVYEIEKGKVRWEDTWQWRWTT